MGDTKGNIRANGEVQSISFRLADCSSSRTVALELIIRGTPRRSAAIAHPTRLLIQWLASALVLVLGVSVPPFGLSSDFAAEFISLPLLRESEAESDSWVADVCDGSEAPTFRTPEFIPIDEPNEKLGYLIVRVVREGTGIPVVGIDVTVSSAPKILSSTPNDVEPRIQTTNTSGETEFVLPSSRDLAATVAIGDDSMHYFNVISPLAPGERKVVTITVARELVLAIQLLNASSKDPIEGADLYLEGVTPNIKPAGSTDENGVVTFQSIQTVGASVTFKKFGYESLVLDLSMSDFEHSGLITAWMTESAVLNIRVLTGGGTAAAGANIQIRALSAEQEKSQIPGDYIWRSWLDTWETVTDGLGTCVIEDLPPNRALTVWCDDSVVTAEPIFLAPRERRTLSLGSDLVSFSGKVVNKEGLPKPMGLVLVRSLGAKPALLTEDLAILQRFQTDMTGHFNLKGVAPGDYHLGPDPNSWGGRHIHRYPRIGVPLKVESGMRDVTIRLAEPVRIQGTCSFPASDFVLDDEPYDRIRIFARSINGSRGVKGGFFGEFDEASGSYVFGNKFDVGPLADDLYELQARTDSGVVLGSVQARGGSADAEIKLERGHDLYFRAQPDQPGRLLIRKKESGAPIFEHHFGQSEEPLFGLSAGEYEALFCPAGNSWAFVPSISVPFDQKQNVPLIPKRGGWLRVRISGGTANPTRVEVRLGELPVGRSLATKGSTVIFRVPAQSELSVYANSRFVRTVEFGPGQERKIEIDV